MLNEKCDYDKIKQKYIDAAIKQKEASYNGDHRIANKQYKILKEIYDLFKNGAIQKELLLDLLKNNNIYVRSWAASHMLGLQFQISLAEDELGKISLDQGMAGFSAGMTLKSWRKNGYLNF